MQRSASDGRSVFSKKEGGSFSPKKTISGFTRPVQGEDRQWGTVLEEMCWRMRVSGKGVLHSMQLCLWGRQCQSQGRSVVVGRVRKE